MRESHHEITDYLTRYAATLTAYDSRASAELWAMPGMIVDDQFAGVLESHEAMARGLEQSYPLYRKLGMASVDYDLLDQQQLSEAITLIRVRWLFRGANGQLLTDSNSCYILRRDEEGLHACVCIQTDDATKLPALAAERGIDLSTLTSS